MEKKKKWVIKIKHWLNIKFVELFNKTNTDNPKEEDVAELRKLFDANPQLYYKKINLSQVAIDSIIETVKGTALVHSHII